MTDPFAVPEDIATVLQRDLTIAEIDAAVLWLGLASNEIADAIGTHFTGGTIDITIDGNWGQWLDLPTAPTSIASVAINGTSLDVGSWFWKAGRRIRRGPDPVEQWDFVDADEPRIYQGAQPGLSVWHWGGSASTVHVVYVAPSKVVPAWLRSMCINLALQRITNPAQVKSEGLGAYNVANNVGDADAAAGQMLSPEQYRMLQRRYRRTTGTIIPTVM